MKIYGHFFSAPANQVRLTASALGLEHEYHHVDLMAEQQKSPEFLAINPIGKVPAIDDDGFTVAESNAISRYLACKQDCSLYPQGPKDRAVIDQWMDFAAHHVRANMAKILFNKVFAPMMEIPVDEKAMQDGRDALNQNLAHVNAALEKAPYIAGNTLTIADTAMMAAMEPFEMIDYDITAFPNVQQWRSNNMSQDWYTSVHAHYAAEMQQ